MTMTKNMNRSQTGGFGVGLIVGLLIGLTLALGVALYITKVPVPFLNKVPQRSPAQDAAEAEKNRNWDPNSPLYGKNPARPSTVASGVVTPAAPPAAEPPAVATLPPSPPAAASAPAARASAPASARDPAAILANRPPAGRTVSNVDTPASDPFTYFVQAGAYGTPEDAEQQRARLAMMGLEARLSEREQAGRTVHRVRLGPFDTKADADAARERLTGSGIEATLVRVQRLAVSVRLAHRMSERHAIITAVATPRFAFRWQESSTPATGTSAARCTAPR